MRKIPDKVKGFSLCLSLWLKTVRIVSRAGF